HPRRGRRDPADRPAAGGGCDPDQPRRARAGRGGGWQAPGRGARRLARAACTRRPAPGRRLRVHRPGRPPCQRCQARCHRRRRPRSATGGRGHRTGLQHGHLPQRRGRPSGGSAAGASAEPGAARDGQSRRSRRAGACRRRHREVHHRAGNGDAAGLGERQGRARDGVGRERPWRNRAACRRTRAGGEGLSMVSGMIDAIHDGFLSFGMLGEGAWIVLKILLIVMPVIIAVAFYVLWERKLIGWMHSRHGPMYVGMGILQTFADVFKLLFKEVIQPSSASPFLYRLAPLIVLVPSFAAWAVVPFDAQLVLSNANAGLLYLLAMTSLGVYGIILAGWASNSKYAFLGAMRAAAQMVSYEI